MYYFFIFFVLLGKWAAYNFIMKLLEQILAELGADGLKSFYVQPNFGGYFRSVKSIQEYSPEKIVLCLRHGRIILEGEKLEIDKYFQEDALIKGEIKGVKIE